jgi:hypothetical protein
VQQVKSIAKEKGTIKAPLTIVHGTKTNNLQFCCRKSRMQMLRKNRMQNGIGSTTIHD